MNKKFFSFFVSFFLPSVLYCIALVMVALHPQQSVELLPALYQLREPSKFSLPMDPTSLSRTQIFQLGQLSQQLATSIELKQESTALKSAQEIVKDLTSSQLLDMKLYLEEYEAGGFSARITGMFNFVNFMWLLSIIGILVAIIPVMILLAKPIMDFLVAIFSNVIYPIFKLFRPFIAYPGYFVCLLFVVQGMRYPHGSASSFYVALTGILGALVVLSGSIALYIKSSGDKRAAQIFALIVYSQLIFFMGSMAPYFQSQLLAYFSVAALFGALGFSIIPVPLGLFLGFENDKVMCRCISASATLVTIFVILKVTKYLYLFQIFFSSISVLGVNVFFLGMLISSSKMHIRCWDSSKPWIIAQLRFVACLLIAILVGNVYSMAGIANVGYVYMVLYGLDKFAELNYFYRGSLRIWVLVMIVSIIVYKLSLFLHSRPEIIMDLFRVVS